MNYQLFHAINRLAGHYDWIDDVMEIFAQDIVWLMISILAVLWFTGKASNQRTVFYACLTASIALLIATTLISPEAAHPRPFVDHSVTQLIPHAADSSFPSDHSTLAFSLAFGVMFAKRRIGLLLLGLASLTGFARVYVGVHYPGDIIGALLLSIAVSLLVWTAQQRIDPVPTFLIQVYRRLIAAIPFAPKK